MEINEVRTTSEIKRFHQVPFDIYKNDKHWIPHIRQDVEKVFTPGKSKAIKEGGEIIRWLLTDNGKDIGRVAAFVNKVTMNTSEITTGGMGFFECANDKDAAFLLFNSCVEWLKKRGMEAMEGPVNFGERNQYWGLMVSNFDNPPVYLQAYNPPYYQKFFDEFGFGIYFEQDIFWRSILEPAQPVFYRKYNQIKNDPRFKITNIRGMTIQKVAEDFRTVYNGGWGDHEHFKPMSEEAAFKIFKSMEKVIDPDIIIFVYYDNKPSAFYISIPELNQVFRHINGNLNWVGKLKFLWHNWLQPSDRMMGIIFGVIKEWQGKGLEAGMIVFGEKTIVPKNKYKDTVLNWIGDFNPKMIKVAENLGATPWRKYYTYKYLFDRTKEFKRSPISNERLNN